MLKIYLDEIFMLNNTFNPLPKSIIDAENYQM